MDLEFNIKRELLKNSYVVVTHRDGDNLYMAKIILGSFNIRPFVNKPN